MTGPVGVVGDTHDRVGLVEAAADLFEEEGVEKVVHVGDVVSPKAARPLERFDLVVVEGNGDRVPELEARAREAGWTFARSWTGAVEGASVAAIHGHRPRETQVLLEDDPDWLLRGHSHRPRDEVQGATRVVNPGALWRVRVPSVALVDVPGGEVTFHVVDGDGTRPVEGLPETWGT